ncbi:MAG: hypothetical protein HYZ57_20130 [Acidobacteria bacterium]|nr:hypothetical protein [Acidobacteriota bacterium]MBI3282136.1 hypothetical protein [Acidobacteriota bacterium]
MAVTPALTLLVVMIGVLLNNQRINGLKHSIGDLREVIRAQASGRMPTSGALRRCSSTNSPSWTRGCRESSLTST